jgi:hypothetical protein
MFYVGQSMCVLLVCIHISHIVRGRISMIQMRQKSFKKFKPRLLFPFNHSYPCPHAFDSYEILSDPDSRAAYDAGGMDGLRAGAGMGDMDDIFAQFFAGSGGFSFGFDLGGGGRPRTKGSDSVHQHQVTLEDLYNGKSVKLNMEKDVVCDVCKGRVFFLLDILFTHPLSQYRR